MKPAILEKTADVVHDSADVAKKAASVVAMGAKAVKGAAVQSYEAAEDAVTFTGRQIRRKPFAATLCAVGLGFAIGFFVGRSARR